MDHLCPRHPLLVCLLFVALSLPAKAQGFLYASDTLPATEWENTWVYLKGTRQMWHYAFDAWTCLTTQPYHIDTTFAWAYGGEFLSGDSPYPVRFTIAPYRDPATRRYTPGAIAKFQSGVHTYYFDPDGNIAAKATADCPESSIPQTVQGQEGYCLNQYHPVMEWEQCFDQRNWGLWSPAGKWLIPPIYDGPFRFVGGVATVHYYGQTLRIDEFGREVAGQEP